MVGERYRFDKGGGRCIVKIRNSVWIGISPSRTHSGTIWIAETHRYQRNEQQRTNHTLHFLILSWILSRIDILSWELRVLDLRIHRGSINVLERVVNSKDSFRDVAQGSKIIRSALTGLSSIASIRPASELPNLA